jgi:ribosomal protein S18 acetylase RimI-like enzyme
MYRIAEVTNDDDVLRIFQGERTWSVYALCDLDEPYRRFVRYLGAWEAERLVSVVQVFSPEGFTSILPYGMHEGVAAILDSSAVLPPQGFFQAREEDVNALRSRYALHDIELMHRMTLDLGDLRTARSRGEECRRLSSEDLTIINDLYAGGEEVMFSAFMVGAGIFVGAFVDDRLVAIAGSHAHSMRHDMAVIGGVFTHPQYRNRGLAKAVTAEVARGLHEIGISAVALNVRRDNVQAIRAYSAVGFRPVMDFVEGRLLSQ